MRGLTEEQRSFLVRCLHPSGIFLADAEQVGELVARGLVRLEVASGEPPREKVHIDRAMCLLALEADMAARQP